MMAFRARLLVAVVAYGMSASAAEPDILELARRDPLKVFVISQDGNKPQMGDLLLPRTVDALADLPHPWTVPGIIKLFEQESDSWLRKLKQRQDEHNPHMWEVSQKEADHCGHLATLLASSRDPRAAVALCRTFDIPMFPDGIRVKEGVYYYFSLDERYKQVPPEHPGEYITTNFYPEMIRHVEKWWALNKSELEAAARTGSNEDK
jgi:hypothetical protein